MVMTRDEAAAALAARTAERDKIQANLLELDGSFGKRLLAGAALTGVTKARWEATAADLATLWEMFTAYSAVIDRAVGLAGQAAQVGKRREEAELAEVATLLRGRSVQVARPLAPLASRGLTESGSDQITVAAAVTEMTSAFARVADVVTAAETVWNELMDRLDTVTSSLRTARQQADGLADEALAGALAAAAAELAALRSAATADPLAFWQRGRTDTARLDRLEQQVARAASAAGELSRLRAGADRRIAAAASAVTAAQAAAQDAMAAEAAAAEKIDAAAVAAASPAALPALREVTAALAARLARLAELKSQGRWQRLGAELDAIDRAAAEATEQFRDAERAAAALLARRSELRGLLDAYRAKAARLGGAEDLGLTAAYQRARDLLWTAPCDLAAAADAVTSYQQAVMKLDMGRPGR